MNELEKASPTSPLEIGDFPSNRLENDEYPQLAGSIFHEEISPLLAASPESWIQTVMGDFDSFLLDHASCERKAASVCLSFISRHSEYPAIAEPLTALAREELDHFAQVYRLIQSRGLTLSYDEPDHYVKQLFAQMRHGAEDRLLDRLVISGIIEARGHERFSLVAHALTDLPLKGFYQTLAKSEAGHYRVFIRIAEKIFGYGPVETAVERFVKLEKDIMLSLPLRPAVH
jgi:tRNA-(ms[2]io[6]A)-hydroxylase